MSTVMKIFLSMSCSGSVLILALLLGKRWWRDKISRQWQYYVWLIVVLRLLLPFGPGVSLLGETYQAMERAMVQAGIVRQWASMQELSMQQELPSGGLGSSIQQEPSSEGLGSSMQQESPTGGLKSFIQQEPSPEQQEPPTGGLGSSMQQELSPGQQEPSSMQQRPSAPEDSGAGHASAADIGENREKANGSAEDFAALHPLRDIAALLINHVWLVWLMGALALLMRKVTIYQSFVRYINASSAPVSDVEMLDRLSHVAGRAGVKRPIELCVNPLISSPLLIGFFRPCIVLPSGDISEKDFQCIALHELTHYKRADMFYKWLVQMTVCLHWFNPLVHLMGREIARACEFSCDEAVLAKMGAGSAQDYGKTLLDAMAVGRFRENPGAVTLSENKQLLKERLEALMKFRGHSKATKILTAALTLCVVLGAAFLGVYTIGDAAGDVQAASLFGALLERLDRTLENGKWDFRSALSQTPGQADAFDELEKEWEKEWEEAQTAEYGAAGITMDGKDYYYQGQLVNIFLDIRANKSFYTLDMNPAGCVNIKVIRDADDKIAGVAYMTEEEAAELLEDMGDDEDEEGDDDAGQEARGGRIWYPQVIPVDLDTMAEGEVVWLGEYALTHGDRIWYAVTAENGKGLQIGFARSGDESLNEVYYSVHNLRQGEEPLECIASAKFEDPAEPGTYRLFLRASDSALENVRGSVSVGLKAEAEPY